MKRYGHFYSRTKRAYVRRGTGAARYFSACPGGVRFPNRHTRRKPVIVKPDGDPVLAGITHFIFKYIKSADGLPGCYLFRGKPDHNWKQFLQNAGRSGTNFAKNLIPLCEKAYRGEEVSFEMSWGARRYEVRLTPHVTERGKTEVIGLVIDTTRYKNVQERMDYLVHHDALTGLPNRKMLARKLHYWKDCARRRNKTVTLMFIDLDRFKFINDTAGHRVGDLLLQEVTKRLRALLGKQAIIARQGGDEFSVAVLSENRKEIEQLARRLLRRLSEPYHVRGQEHLITVSMGISLYPEDTPDIEHLIRNADAAMYLAKEKGNHYSFYHPEMNATLSRTLEMEKGLRKALENREFVLYYQPQIELESGKMIGMEALIRWIHPQKGMISPAEFIPVAEETGWIVPIGEWVLATACRQNRIWQEAGYPPMKMAVNVSAKQFQQPRFGELVFRILRETGMTPEYLELEMTESILQNADTVVAELRMLKERGVQLSIDDFGTGYSSLSYLQRFPVDALKIDRTFIHDFATSRNGSAIVKAIIAMAESLCLKVVAEGIETREQEAFLRQEHCHAGQGFLFSPPLPAERFERLLSAYTKRLPYSSMS